MDGLFKSWRCRRCCTCCRRAGEPKQNMPMPLKAPHFELSSFDSRRPSNCRYNWTITSFNSICKGKMVASNKKGPWFEPCYLKLNFLCQLPRMPLKSLSFWAEQFWLKKSRHPIDCCYNLTKIIYCYGWTFQILETSVLLYLLQTSGWT